MKGTMKMLVVVMVVVGLFTLPARGDFASYRQRAKREALPQETNTLNGGGTPAGGTCPEFCPFDYTPVCGSDGITYTNPCSLSLAACKDPSITASYMGACDLFLSATTSAPTTQGTTGGGAASTCPEACPQVFAPVCGSDGSTYSNTCQLQLIACLLGIEITVVAERACEDLTTTTTTPTEAPKCPNQCPRVSFPVCGSDGVTYENMCVLEVADCESRAAGGPSIIVASEGPCGAPSPTPAPQPTTCSKQCTRIFLPVCGSDGNTYNNLCLLEIADCESKAAGGAGVSLASESTCKATTTAPEVSTCLKQCTRIFLPVCGSDGNTYNNLCLLEIADCESKAAGGAGVSLASEGACGTPEPTDSPRVKDKDVSVSCRRQCSRALVPVCGSDGNTHDNECLMENASCRSLHEGGRRIYLEYNGPCDTMFESLGSGCRTKCSEKYEPVCGSDGFTYDNECVMEASNCGRWARKEQGVYIVDDGPCGNKASRPGEYEPSYNIVLASSLPQSPPSPNSPTSSTGLSSTNPNIPGPSSTKLSSSSSPVCSEACTREFRPLCGSDGVTYNNPCALEVANCRSRARGGVAVEKEFEGPCVAALPRGPECEARCDRRYKPVCGSDGETYNNVCLLEYADCLNLFASITLKSEGPCERQGAPASPSDDSEESSEELMSLESTLQITYVLPV